MVIIKDLNISIIMALITTVVLILIFWIKNKAEINNDTQIFECGEHVVGSATRQYRVENIVELIRDLLLYATLLLQLGWINEFIETGSENSFWGVIIMLLVWFMSYIYSFRISTEE